MKLVNNTGTLMRKFGLEKAVDMLIESGVDAIDLTFPDDCYKDMPTDKAFYTELRKKAEDKGLCFSQAHAPAPSSYVDNAQSEEMFKDIVSTIERASLVGAKNIVVHPCQHLYYVDKGAPEYLFEYNMKFFRRLIPYAEEYGITVAIENMWQWFKRDQPDIIGHSTCSRPAEMIRYVDELNHPLMKCCLDIGHAAIVREQPDEFIRALGNNRLACLHVHDVDGADDSHTLPYFGIVRWEQVMQALAEIDYKGDLTYEAVCFFNTKPDALVPAYLKLMEQTGRYLISIYEGAKK